MTGIRETLSFYATQIPTNVGGAVSSLQYGGHGRSLVELRRVAGQRLTEDTVEVIDPADGEGVVVILTERESDPFDETFYTMQRDLVSTFVGKVARQTDYVIEESDEEYTSEPMDVEKSSQLVRVCGGYYTFDGEYDPVEAKERLTERLEKIDEQTAPLGSSNRPL